MLVNTLTIISVLLGLVRLVDTCTVTIEDGTGTEPVIGEGIGVRCFISSCDNISKVVFYKEDEAVYEGISQSEHHALNTDAVYNLDGRVEGYLALRNVHSLYIRPVILQDHGSWRCVVYKNNDEYKSDPVTINIYAKPEDEDILKNKSSSQYVTDRPQTFTCEVKDVHPRPTLTWTLNEEKQDGASGEPVLQADGLWSLRSTLELTFTKSEIVTLECVMSAGDRQAWMKDEINIDVKEGAKLIDTKYPKGHTLPNVSFTLTCVGSGYRRRISWRKNGKVIKENGMYHIQNCDDQDETCTSTLKSKPVRSESQCHEAYANSGNYTCVVDLDAVFDSRDESLPMTIVISHAPITIGTAKNTTSRRCSETTTLRCDVCSRNPISDEWYIGGVPINRADVEHALHGEIQSSHFYYGQYKRIVETSEGRTECVVHYVEGGYDICSGEITGIVIGVIMLVIVLIGAVVFWYLQKRKKRTEDLDIENEYENVHTVTTSTSNPLPVPSRPVEAARDDVNQENSSHNAVATDYGDERTYMRLDNDGQAVYVNRDVNVYDIVNK